MRFKVVRNLTENLKASKDTNAFIEMVELRQRLFREHKRNLLVLDAYDLISDHVMLYSGTDGRMIGYLRSVPASKCIAYDLPFPIFALLGDYEEYRAGLQSFRDRAGDPLHMGYLCFDARYREELRGVKVIDLLAWMAFRVSGVPHTQAGLTATLNNRYKQDEPMRLLGEWIEGQADFHHPVVKDLHRVVLVPRISPNYWDKQLEKFRNAYGALDDGEVDLLRDDSKIAA